MSNRDETMQRVAEAAWGYYNKAGMQWPEGGKKNLYQCEANPLHLMATVDREPGVTPFTTPCAQCRAMGVKVERSFYGGTPAMQSLMYRVHQNIVPTHEWYRPDTVKGLKPGEAEHAINGGLLLREIVKEEKE